jgi:phosphohistidine phosphatase
MKTLFLLRHAKSEDIGFFQKDYERHIVDRGINEMHILAKHFNQKYPIPDLILCSSATRTTETLNEFLKFNTIDAGKIIFLKELYHASASEIFNSINAHFNECERLMLVGHNFGISSLANLLSETGAPELKTSCMHIIQFLDQMEIYKGKLITTIQPKLLK